MPNDVTCLCGGLHVLFHLLCTLFYAPISYTAKPPYLCIFLFFFQYTFTHTHSHKWEGKGSEWALILAIWMAYRCNFSKHTSQTLPMPSKTPGGALAYSSV